MPGAAGPAWVLGSSPHGPKLLNGDVQGDNQGSEFFVGKQIQFPCFPKKKKKKKIRSSGNVQRTREYTSEVRF